MARFKMQGQPLHVGNIPYAQPLQYTQQHPMQILQHLQAPQMYIQTPQTLEVHQPQKTPPDLNWIGPSTKYKTHYITVPMIKPVKKMVKKVETVMVDEKYWDTKWIAVQVVLLWGFILILNVSSRLNQSVSSGSKNRHGRSSCVGRRGGANCTFHFYPRRLPDQYSNRLLLSTKWSIRERLKYLTR